jgi:broad specificity phosphatase PhoE
VSSVLDRFSRPEGSDDPGAVTVEVLLARHPEVEANVNGRFVGRGESPFTPLGLRQRTLLVPCIAAWGPSCVHASPRERARVVAQDVGERASVRTHVDEGLAEIDFGAAEGLTYDEATLRGVEIDLLGGPADSAPFSGGESWESFAGRVAAAADRAEACGGRVAVIAHGGVVRALLTHWLGMPHQSAWSFAVGNASVATITLWQGRGTLRTFGVAPGCCEWERR